MLQGQGNVKEGSRQGQIRVKATQAQPRPQQQFDGFWHNTSLAAPGALANRLQRRTARKANEANLDPPNQKSVITSL